LRGLSCAVLGFELDEKGAFAGLGLLREEPTLPCEDVGLLQARGDDALEVAEGERRIAVAWIGSGLVEELDTAAPIGEEVRIESVAILMSDVPEAEIEPAVQAGGEQSLRAILGDETQEPVAEFCFVGDGAPFGSHELSRIEFGQAERALDGVRNHRTLLKGLD
jgi:hypothetical protein